MKLLAVFLLLGCSIGCCFEKNSVDGIEYFLEKPTGDGVFPAVVMIHGFQPEGNSPGGQECLNGPIFPGLLSENMIAVAISIPGFGESEGKRDYCGPIAQNAVITLINHLKTLPYVDKT